MNPSEASKAFSRLTVSGSYFLNSPPKSGVTARSSPVDINRAGKPYLGISISYPENPSLGRYNRNAKSNANSYRDCKSKRKHYKERNIDNGKSI
ncbi:MAG: hypothetical protein AAFX80_11405 [Cyanobacteria bacterium J06639_18]